MSAAVDRTRWARRPSPRTLEEIAEIAHRGGHRLRARVPLEHDPARSEAFGEVYFDGATVLHAKLGWALGRRALARLRAAEPFTGVHVQLHAVPELVTLGEPWAVHAATPRTPQGSARRRAA